MMQSIITEEYSLPSMGMIYGKPFDPDVKLRSMTVADEMKRLSPSKNEYKAMCEIIENCLENKLPIPVYDLCIGDYTYLLHKLRVVTYGPNYSMNVICPKCQKLSQVNINLDDLTVNRYDKSVESMKTITLPSTGKEVVLRFQTPRDLDKIENRLRDFNEKYPEYGDQRILFTLESLIDTIDGESIDPVLGLEGLKKLPMMDMNYLVQKATQLQGKVGLDVKVRAHCDKCHQDIDTTFRFSSEFFGPKVY